MRIYIAADMEGISGISCSEYLIGDGKLLPVGRRLLTQDINAAVCGAFDGGADQVIVADVHGAKVNVLVEELDPRALLLSGWPRRQKSRFPFLDRTVDGMFLLGYHAMAGTEDATLEHTMSSASWHRYQVNGKDYGELAIDAEIAAEAGVPVVMVSGDDKLYAEAHAHLGGVEVAVVKQGLGRQTALCLSPEEGRKRVYAAAKRAVERLAEGDTFAMPEIPHPARVAITYKMVPDADAANQYGTKRLDGYTVETEYEYLSHAFGGLWEQVGTELVL